MVDDSTAAPADAGAATVPPGLPEAPDVAVFGASTPEGAAAGDGVLEIAVARGDDATLARARSEAGAADSEPAPAPAVVPAGVAPPEPAPAAATPPPAPATAATAEPAAAPQPEPLPSPAAALAADLAAARESLRALASSYEELKKDAHRRQKAYDFLYEEMKGYKDDWMRKAQKPVFLDLILLFDSLARAKRKYENARAAAAGAPAEGAGPAPDQDSQQEMRVAAALLEEDGRPGPKLLGELAHDLDMLCEQLLELLYRRDIERIDETPGKLDARVQKAVRRIDTASSAEDKDVVRVVRDGFTWNGAILRPQEIVVKRFKGS